MQLISTLFESKKNVGRLIRQELNLAKSFSKSDVSDNRKVVYGRLYETRKQPFADILQDRCS